MIRNVMLSGHLGVVTEQVNEYLSQGAFVRPDSTVLTYHPEQKCMVMVCVVAWEDPPRAPLKVTEHKNPLLDLPV